MIRLRCPVCGAEVYFDSLVCVACWTELVLAPTDRWRHRGVVDRRPEAVLAA